MTTATTTLSERHRAELYASGLSDETIEAAGIYSTDAAGVKAILGWAPKDADWGNAMVFFFPSRNGEADDYRRVKPDFPRERDGKPVKYETPKGAPNRAYFPPGFCDALEGAGVVVVTEGEKKALAGMQAGFPTIGLVGVWGWQERRKRADTGRAFGKRRLIDDLADIEWKRRRVVIVFDADAGTKPEVQLAETRLAETLSAAGADVRVVRLPANGDGKVGLDDFLVAHGDAGPAKLRELIDAAKKPELPEHPTPMDWARMFVDEHFTARHGRTLQWHRDEYWRWDATRYIRVPESELAAIVLKWLDKRTKEATPRRAADVVKALAAVCRVPYTLEQPVFLDNRRKPAPDNVIAFANTLLDISQTGGDLKLYDHTPAWFSPTALPYIFAPDADCPQWKAFVDEVLEDGDCIDLLQQWFGLCLTPDMSYQKLLMLVGPKRSGKGTVLRILQHVIGPAACASPTLSSLAGEFGLWQLVGKTVAMFPDAHLGYRVDSMRVLEIIKSIVGEDPVSINRKNLPYLTNVRLRVRFMVTVNELPRFSDASDALGARLLLLPFEKSFAGREDRELEGRLKREASGVLNWSLRGLHRLRSQGRFKVPAKTEETLENYRRMTAPVAGFVEDLCTLDPQVEVPCADLFDAWRAWARDNGHTPGAIATFGEHLRASEPAVQRRRRRDDGDRTYVYCGIDLSGDGLAALERYRTKRTENGKDNGCP